MSDGSSNALGLIQQLCELPLPPAGSPKEWEGFIQRRQELLDQFTGEIPTSGISEEVLERLRDQCEAVEEATRTLWGEHERLGAELVKLRATRARLKRSVVQLRPFRGNLDVTA